MPSKLPPRIGMPTISAAAHRNMSRSTSYNNPPKEIKKLTSTISAQEKATILADCQAAKQNLTPLIKEAKQKVDAITLMLIEAQKQWQSLATEYEQLDYQEKILTHEEKIITKAKTASATKSKSTEQSATKLAMKILANLSPEEQAKILAIIKQQSS